MSSRNVFVIGVLLALADVGCQLVATFDEDKIPKRTQRGDSSVEPSKDFYICNPDKEECSAVCGNGTVEPGETCDPMSSCPTGCDDGTACTDDIAAGDAQTCNFICKHEPIRKCVNDDHCCPAGCNYSHDSDCTTSCGNGTVEPGETCDPTLLCPTDCSDGNSCTVDTTIGSVSNCNTACSHELITRCGNNDQCCPAGCNSINDRDCTKSCGNGTVEPGETCDPPESCPANCDDGTACTIDTLTGSAANCNAACSHQTITACKADDGCCPPGCNAGSDTECSSSCGNGTVEPGETCDPSDACPTDCNDGNACTIDSMTGNAAYCTAACTHQTITDCQNGDGCCPAGCTAQNDGDCSAHCGNGVLEPGETCDPSSACPTDCSDGNSCTIDTVTGNATSCTAACVHQTITECKSGDHCCPAGCNAREDGDCPAHCNNAELEPGETCDPISSCPTACNDGNGCTIDTLTGGADNCTASCSYQPITECKSNDGCCPAGCNANRDSDCPAHCNNAELEPGETCDPISTCPTSCSDGNACTIDNATGSADNCTAACSYQPITQCRNNDGCCPSSCTANDDDNCSATCGNGVIETGETCDPAETCPSSCDDNIGCTLDSLTGSASNCSAACSHQPISQCKHGDRCCPAGCNALNDDDCSASCGNGTIEPGETCDGNCPTSCDDDNPCTLDRGTGTAVNCNVACSNDRITECNNTDGCCPNGCNAKNDLNCPPVCGNGTIEPGETCDPVNACPKNCHKDNCATTVELVGSADSCTAKCVYTWITECVGGDKCCPADCNANNDNNCYPKCGNGEIEEGETCDPCPSGCDDGLICTTDALESGNASECTAVCSHTDITACVSGDGCCLMSCDSGNDNDCITTI
jgi:hypothetical protein